MFESAIEWANEYLEKGKPEKAAEVFERFIRIKLVKYPAITIGGSYDAGF